MLHNSATKLASHASLLGRLGGVALASVSFAALTLGSGLGSELGSEQKLGEGPTSEPTSVEVTAPTYRIKLEAPNHEALGRVVAHLSQGSSAGDDWLAVRVIEAAGAEDNGLLVQIRGASVSSMKELQEFAREAGVLLVSVIREQAQMGGGALGETKGDESSQGGEFPFPLVHDGNESDASVTLRLPAHLLPKISFSWPSLTESQRNDQRKVFMFSLSLR